MVECVASYTSTHDCGLSPSFFSHLTMLPSSMVGDRAGICTLTGATPRGQTGEQHQTRAHKRIQEFTWMVF